RQAVAVLRPHAARTEVARLLHMPIRGRHEELVRRARSGGSNPPVVAGRVEPPDVVLVRFGDHGRHRIPPDRARPCAPSSSPMLPYRLATFAVGPAGQHSSSVTSHFASLLWTHALSSPPLVSMVNFASSSL